MDGAVPHGPERSGTGDARLQGAALGILALGLCLPWFPDPEATRLVRGALGVLMGRLGWSMARHLEPPDAAALRLLLGALGGAGLGLLAAQGLGLDTGLSLVGMTAHGAGHAWVDRPGWLVAALGAALGTRAARGGAAQVGGGGPADQLPGLTRLYAGLVLAIALAAAVPAGRGPLGVAVLLTALTTATGLTLHAHVTRDRAASDRRQAQARPEGHDDEGATGAPTADGRA